MTTKNELLDSIRINPVFTNDEIHAWGVSHKGLDKVFLFDDILKAETYIVGLIAGAKATLQ